MTITRTDLKIQMTTDEEGHIYRRSAWGAIYYKQIAPGKWTEEKPPAATLKDLNRQMMDDDTTTLNPIREQAGAWYEVATATEYSAQGRTYWEAWQPIELINLTDPSFFYLVNGKDYNYFKTYQAAEAGARNQAGVIKVGVKSDGKEDLFMTIKRGIK